MLTISDATLIVSIIGVLVSIVIYKRTRKRERQNLQHLIKNKEAQLKSMEMSMRAGFNVSEYGGLNMQISALQAEIEQLKEQL